MYLPVKLALISIASLTMTAAHAPGAASYMVRLTGEAEVESGAAPGEGGDMDGSGQVKLSLDPDGRQFCYDFTLAKLGTPLMAHIHRGTATHNGPSVVTLFTGPGGELNGCKIWTEKRLSEIVADPANFYVNLYTTEYPEGALRGQLPG